MEISASIVASSALTDAHIVVLHNVVLHVAKNLLMS